MQEWPKPFLIILAALCNRSSTHPLTPKRTETQLSILGFFLQAQHWRFGHIRTANSPLLSAKFYSTQTTQITYQWQVAETGLGCLFSQSASQKHLSLSSTEVFTLGPKKIPQDVMQMLQSAVWTKWYHLWHKLDAINRRKAGVMWLLERIAITFH